MNETTNEQEVLLLRRKLDLLLRTGKLLMESAADTNRIERNMKRVAAYLGIPEEKLHISVKISNAVTSIIGKFSVKPKFIIAKGGITSSDVGTKALRVKKARVMGQVKKGIPVWMTGEESKFPGMPYIIFPGNVGEVSTLKEIVEELI